MILTVALSFSQAQDIKTQKYNKLNPAVVQVYLSESTTLGKIIDNDFAILEIDEEYVIIFASYDQITWLEDQNLKLKILYNDYAEMMGWKNNPELLDDFHSYDELTTELQNIASTYSSISKLYNLGSSVQGRTIWGLKVTDNPDVEENEAEVRICGLHHGNEIMSVELPLMLAWYMVENYESNPDIQDLVDNRETWIIPMVNPDGREMGSRYNANGVDLNRDYGYMWNGEGGSPSPFSQPETKVIRKHSLDNNFVFSLSFHTSGDIVNYIWNYKGEPVADNDVVVALSEQYGSHNNYWVVEGYDWYQTRGDTNDFSYGCRGDIDWTIELQNNNIAQAWDYNRDAMLEIIDAADMGLNGIITDNDTGLPVAATIWIEEVYWPCFTDPKIGDFHKPLMPGSYNVIIRANGYQDQTHQVVVNDGETTTLDVSLVPENNFFAEQVTLCYFHDPYGYPNNFKNNPTEGISALGPPDGICASLGKGGYIVLDMGEEGIIIDHEDSTDFKIFEEDESDDSYDVYISSNWSGPWTYLGLATGTTEFDLNDFSVSQAQFVKIVDDDDGDPYESNPGVDIDAIQHIIPFTNNPPLVPEINGPKTGKPGTEYEFTFSTTDPESNNVYYYIIWDDGYIESWIGPYNSGETINVSHTWAYQGDYTIRAKAKDSYNEESEFSELEIEIPRSRISKISLLSKYFEHFLNVLPSIILILKSIRK
ncbi:MAG: carboxypeptidase regulatory-like domain-containing protein [Thermoplasmatales archaeon]|nr:MAG: carboxypeptidase regulatory-like domain-containing protein [Thermoplasmatales archaeon]